MIRIKFKNYFLLIIILLLTSCSFLSPVKVDVQNNYLLNTVPKNIPQKTPRHISLLILSPDSRPIYNTRQIAYTIKPYQVAYFSQSEWAETPSQMFQTLLTESFERSHYFRAVVNPPYAGHYDYILATKILELEQDYVYYPTMRVSIKIEIINARTNQMIATKLFSIHAPIIEKSPYGGIVAANKAASLIVEKITRFGLEKIR